jgi:hypothetical protein
MRRAAGCGGLELCRARAGRSTRAPVVVRDIRRLRPRPRSGFRLLAPRPWAGVRLLRRAQARELNGFGERLCLRLTQPCGGRRQDEDGRHRSTRPNEREPSHVKQDAWQP